MTGVLSCLWDGAYQQSLAVNRELVAVDFFSYLSGLLPYVQHLITVNKMCHVHHVFVSFLQPTKNINFFHAAKVPMLCRKYSFVNNSSFSPQLELMELICKIQDSLL